MRTAYTQRHSIGICADAHRSRNRILYCLRALFFHAHQTSLLSVSIFHFAGWFRTHVPPHITNACLCVCNVAVIVVSVFTHLRQAHFIASTRWCSVLYFVFRFFFFSNCGNAPAILLKHCSFYSQKNVICRALCCVRYVCV